MTPSPRGAKVLIVSSEPLHPADTFSSTFELSQARVLSRGYTVAILSIRECTPLLEQAKAVARSALSARRVCEVASMVGDVRRLARDLWSFVSRSGSVSVYTIRGIRVFEGRTVSLRKSRTFEELVSSWLRAAQAAFSEHNKASGLPDLVHAHGRFLLAGVLALWVYRVRGVPYVYTEHSSFYERRLAPPESRPILEDVVKNATVTIGVSRPLLSSVESFLGARIENSAIVPNVLDPDFEMRAILPSSDRTPFTFVTIGTLDRQKGLDILIHAFKEAFAGDEDYRLIVCGHGPLRKELEVDALELGLETTVEFVGLLSKREVLRTIDSSNALVLSSRFETFGVVVIESLSRGRPVVATRCGGPETILRADLGILVKPGDIQDMAAALRQMALNYGHYDGCKIREHALRTYGSQPFLKHMRAIYDRATNVSSGGS